VGVESYFCDLSKGAETFYQIDGETHTEKMILPVMPIAEEFSSADLVAAIRGAQADTIRYPEFMKRSASAGVIAYWALTGKGHLLGERQLPLGSSARSRRVFRWKRRPGAKAQILAGNFS
jgi:uncharacterized protein YbcV (DUF1398 family)